MSLLTIQDSLDTLEPSISVLEKDLENCTQLYNLTTQIPNLLKIESLLPIYKKKHLRLKTLLTSSKSQILKQKIPSPNKNRSFSHRPSLLTAITHKKLEILFKQEACGVVSHLTNHFESLNSHINSLLSRLNADVKYPLNQNIQIPLIPNNNPPSTLKSLRQPYIKSAKDSVKTRCSSIITQKLSEFEESIQKSLKTIQDL